MGKRIYLFVYFVVIHQFWGLKPIGDINRDIFLLFLLILIFLGFYFFRNPGFSIRNRILLPFGLILLGIIGSMIPAFLFYGQGILQSVITYRWQILWISIPWLIYIAPSRNDIIQASWWLTLLMFSVILIREAAPSLFIISDDMEMARLKGDTGLFVDGFVFAVIPIFHYLEKIRRSFDFYSLFVVVICLSFLFLVQNRSALFTVLLIIVFSIVTAKSRDRKFIWIITAGLCVLTLCLTIDVWVALFEETNAQLGDENYNRAKAFAYFLSPLANPSYVTYVLGNGFLSAHSSPLMADMMEQGVYNSDVGFVGFWNQFGLLPIAVFFYLLLKPLFAGCPRYRLAFIRRPGMRKLVVIKCSKPSRYSFYLKEFSVFLMVTSLTIGYYGRVSPMVVFALYYYLLQNENTVYNSSLSF